MENQKLVQSLGFLIKKETLTPFESDYKYSEMILEDMDPYPGFYDHFHIPVNEEEKKPRSIFAVTKELSFEQMNDFIRISGIIKAHWHVKFNAVIGRIDFQNGLVNCIRIYMDDYSELPQLIQLYKHHGIEFQTAKSVKPYTSLIYIWKYYVLEEIIPQIYRDTELKDTYYFTVSKHVNWKTFETISTSIRNNNNHKVYDAAQAGYYSHEGIIELVRIYDQKATLDNLIFLKEKYELEIERSHFQLA